MQQALNKAIRSQEMDSLVTAIQSVWCTAERGEWMTESKGDSAEELQCRAREANLWSNVFEIGVKGTERTSAELSSEWFLKLLWVFSFHY